MRNKSRSRSQAVHFSQTVNATRKGAVVSWVRTNEQDPKVLSTYKFESIRLARRFMRTGKPDGGRMQ
jgi:hypothetical protein